MTVRQPTERHGAPAGFDERQLRHPTPAFPRTTNTPNRRVVAALGPSGAFLAFGPTFSTAPPSLRVPEAPRPR